MTTKKTGAREVVSLDSLAQQRRDALPEPAVFELLGVEFTLPPIKAIPFEMQERVGDLDNTVAVLKDLLGADKVKEMYAMRLHLRRPGADRRGVAEALRPGAGESAASPSS